MSMMDHKGPSTEKRNSLIMEYMTGSTIHGFSQLSRAKNIVTRIIWLLSIISTATLSAYMIYYCYQGWEDNPILTSVAQIPIESIVFPPVTICPLYSSAVNDSLRLSDSSNTSEFLWSCSFRKNDIDEGKVCNRIQVVSSELGYCFTFNNVDITLSNTEGPSKVTGVGKNNGLQLVLNPNPLGLPTKYRVFISEIGTTYSKVYFDVNVTQPGELVFDVHGLHLVKAGQGFAEWNKDREACLFPDQKKLSYFNNYMQSNCRLECGWNRTIGTCGCAPKQFALKNIPVCGEKDLECWRDTMVKVTNEPEDPSCGCKVDCEMTHFFYSMRRVDTEEREYNSAKLLFHFDTHIITQINIQLRLSFFDKVASIGGMLGLFSGISIISVIEIVFYLTLLMTVSTCATKATAPTQVSPAPVTIYSSKYYN